MLAKGNYALQSGAERCRAEKPMMYLAAYVKIYRHGPVNDFPCSTGWGAADANEEIDAVKQPKQGFSLNFARPASKSKVLPYNTPPPLAASVQIPSQPPDGAPADSQQSHLNTEAREEPSEELKPRKAVRSMSPEEIIAVGPALSTEGSWPGDLSAQPTTAPDNSNKLVSPEAEANTDLQQQIRAGGGGSTDALHDVKAENQRLASEEEGPPGDDGPPGGEYLTYETHDRLLYGATNAACSVLTH